MHCNHFQSKITATSLKKLVTTPKKRKLDEKKKKTNGFIDFWILNLRKGILFMSEGHVSVLFEFNSRRRVMNENSHSNGSKLSLLGT